MYSLLINEQIFLRAVEPEDLDVMYQMENDPEMWDISNFIEPYSRHLLREYISSSQNDVFADRQLRLMIVWRATGEVAGTLDLDSFEPRHARAGVGIAVRRHFRNHNVGTQALGLLVEYAFSFLHLHQLYAYVPVHNTASISLFKKAGFSSVAVLKDWIHASEGYEDIYLLQLLNY